MSEIKIESPHPRDDVLYWYPPKDVVQYRQEHVLWLLRHIPELKADCYPGGNAGLGCIFSPIPVHWELTTRLKQCGLDGLLLLIRESFDMPEAELSEYLNQSVSEIEGRANTALRYVSGKERKWEKREGWDPVTYQEFKHLVELADKQTENRSLK